MSGHPANPIYDAVFKYHLEEERFLTIENHDTAIMLLDEKIARQDATIAEKDGQLAEEDRTFWDMPRHGDSQACQ